ncbi:MAG: OmpA family protein [Flavisolibacter sp.]
MFFKTSSTVLVRSSYAALNEVAEVLRANQYMRLSIEGHTDNVGTAEFNQLLNENRANAVADYLANKGVEEHRLHSVGYGFSKPVADNASEEGRRKNRRVEMKIFY